MAITIVSNSPISSTGGTQYVNSTNFDSRLYFNHASSNLYYMLFVQKDSSSFYMHEVGRLDGYNNSTSYSYKFDFDRHISFNNQFKNTDLTVTTGGFLTTGFNKVTVAFCYSTSSTFYEDNLAGGKLEVTSDGQVRIKSPNLPSGLIQDGYCQYIFKDAVANPANSYLLTPATTIYRGSYLPFIHNSGYKVEVKQVNDNNTTNTVTYSSVTSKDYTITFVKINDTTKTINWKLLNSDSVYANLSGSSNTLCNINSNFYYYFNQDSDMKVINLTGTRNIIDTVEREETKLKNGKIILNIKKNKKISQNSGFNITDTQIRDMLSAPFIYQFEGNILKQYTIDNDTFAGFEGTNLSGRNIEILLTDTKTYERKTTSIINFFD